MASKLKRWWYGKNISFPSIGEDIINICIKYHLRNLLDLFPLLRICKSVCKSTSTNMIALYDIINMPIYSNKSNLSQLQIEMFSANVNLMQNHSTWFILGIKYELLDMISIPVDKHRKRCNILRCGPICNYILSDDEAILAFYYLKRTKTLYKELRHNLSYNIINNNHIIYILPWWLYMGIEPILVVKLIIKYQDLPHVQRFLIWIKEMTIFDSYWSILYKELCTKLGDNLGLKSWEIEGYSVMRSILYDPYANYYKLSRMIVNIGSGTIVSGIINFSSIISTPKQNIISAIHVGDSEGFSLFIEKGGKEMVCVTECVRFLIDVCGEFPLSEWPMVTPIGTSGVCIRCKDNRMLKTIYGSFELYGSVTQYARFTVLCYLFGISSSTVIITQKGIFPIGYTEEEMFQDHEMMISDLVYEMGGRYSHSFELFRTTADNLLKKYRMYYDFIKHILSPLNISLDRLYERWVPKVDGETLALSRFNATLESSLKGKLGWWVLLGY